jgi:hypothetical protein
LAILPLMVLSSMSAIISASAAGVSASWSMAILASCAVW